MPAYDQERRNVQFAILFKEGFARCKLKHSTITLIGDVTSVIALATQEHVTQKRQRSHSPRRQQCLISLKGLEEADDRFILPEIHPESAPPSRILRRGCVK